MAGAAGRSVTWHLAELATGSVDPADLDPPTRETRKLYMPGDVEVSTSVGVPADLLPDPDTGTVRGLIVDDRSGRVYLLEACDGAPTSGQSKVLSGGSLGTLFADTATVPPAGQSHSVYRGPVEARMKALVADHATVPGMTVAPDQGRGPSGVWPTRYRYLDAELARLGAAAGVGWDVVSVDPLGAPGRYLFGTVHGTDRRDEVTLSLANATITAEAPVLSAKGVKTYAVVLGWGQGVKRIRVNRWPGIDAAAPAPTGFARRVLVVDARDVQAGREPFEFDGFDPPFQGTNETLVDYRARRDDLRGAWERARQDALVAHRAAQLAAEADAVEELRERGDAALAETEQEATYEVAVDPDVVGAVDLGDLYRYQPSWGAAARVERVVELDVDHTTGQTTVVLGRPRQSFPRSEPVE